MGNKETATKLSRLKSISSIEDNFLETATGVLSKISQRNIHRKATVLESLFNKVAEKRLQHSCFLCTLRIFICFEICERLLLIILLL